MNLLYDDVLAKPDEGGRMGSIAIMLNAFLIFVYLMTVLVFAFFLSGYGFGESDMRSAVMVAVIKMTDMPLFALWVGLAIVGRHIAVGEINRWIPIGTGVLFTILPLLPMSERLIGGLGMMIAVVSALFVLVESKKMYLAQSKGSSAA